MVVDDGEGNKAPRLNPPLITEACKSALFWEFSRMVLYLQAMTDHLLSWAEGCVCHSHITGDTSEVVVGRRSVHKMSKDTRERLFQRCAGGKEFVGMHSVCPCRGCRAPELAAGALQALFDRICTCLTADMLQSLRGRLDMSDMNKLTADFEAGKAHMQTVLRIKTQCWSLLPWKLAALGHHDAHTARTVVAEARRMFDSSDAPPDAHHRVTRQSLGKDTAVRAELDLWLDSGKTLSEFPRLLAFAVQLKFMPIVERGAESGHAK
eukprot:15479556-Alexandrium_andersonii.AAC.1